MYAATVPVSRVRFIEFAINAGVPSKTGLCWACWLYDSGMNADTGLA